MAAQKSQKLVINFDLLHPQSNPEKLPTKFLKWLFSSGRFIFIFVEALVLVVFILRFKFDADLATKKDAIDQEITYIQSLRPYEILIRQTQAKISTIADLHTNSPNYSQILKNIANQTPTGVKITTLNITRGVGKVTISINAEAQNNSDLSSFTQGLKEGGFSKVTLASVGLDQGLIRFTLSLEAAIQNAAGKSL